MTIDSAPELAGVARMARDDPTRVAVELTQRQLTYAEVDYMANRLAERLLADCGLSGTSERTHPCIPFLVEGTVELLVAAEAVERAGMIFVPLDPSTPESRVSRIIAEVEASVLVTDLHSGLLHGVPCRHPLRDGLSLTGASIRREPGPVHSIVFTSGSTGQPKGIVKPPNQYGAISDFLRLGFGLEGALRVGILTAGSVAASVPVLQILLDNGFTIVAHEMRREQESVGEWLRHANIAVLAAVPTLLRHVLTSLSPYEVVQGLRFVAVFGESTTWDDVGKLRQHLPPGASIFNVYGQGEAGSIAVMPIGPDTPIGHGLLPVGHPLPGRIVSIVDEEGQTVPAGETGEIVVAGPSVSLGYWKEDETTGLSGVFTKNEDGVIVVRTGDAGRLRVDGILEHLGRLDHIVKIAGNRVDLAEIETALLNLPHIVDAVAATYTDDSNELRLRAFVVVDDSTLANTRTLRGQLGQQLARPLLPDVIEVLGELPRLPNGKINRQGLPTKVPQLTWAQHSVADRPTDEIERTVISLWGNVLGVDDIGIDDDFFDLGGDSLRAVRLAEHIGRHFEIDVPAWMLIEHPTPAGLAAALREGSRVGPVVTIQAATEGTPIFVAHDNFGSLFGARYYLTAIGLEQPIYGLRAAAWEGRPTGRTLQEVAAEHINAIVATHPSGPVILYGQATGSLFAFEIARQLMVRGFDVPLLVVATAPGPPLPPFPNPARIRQMWGTYASVPRGERGRTTVNFLITEGKHVARRWPSRVREPARTKDEGSLPGLASVDTALERYGAMAFQYRPPSRYPGPILLIKPSWMERPIETRWKYWAQGPLRVADVEELRTDLYGHRPRQLESLAPRTIGR